MWLNLVTSTKLPTYPEEGSSHHVVQQIFFYETFFLWSLFLVHNWTQQKDTKLPTYPQKGSSQHVVQKIFLFYFFFDNFFFLFFLCVFAKRRAQCVIVGITTNGTWDSLKGDMGIQPLHHTSNCWHRVGLISPYWYAFKGNGKTSCTLAALQWVV